MNAATNTVLLLVALFFSGCAGLPMFKSPASTADGIAARAGFTKEYVNPCMFNLLTFHKFDPTAKVLNIYIEGDGRAWLNKHELSDDPSPMHPVALELAAQDASGNVAYIARPGQYSPTGIPHCAAKYWAGSRFSPQVIKAMDEAITILEKEAGANQVVLTGYSGGGAVAVLVAAQRTDVVGLRTVAGNLNPSAWCAQHHVSPLKGSLDPMTVAAKVAGIRQRHFVGSKDQNVPMVMAKSFVAKAGDKDNRRITLVDGASHNDGWSQRWRELLKIELSQ